MATTDGGGWVDEEPLFWKRRVEHMDKELSRLQAYLERALSALAETHARRQQSHEREARYVLVQRAHDDAQVLLWEEREQRLQLDVENEALRSRVDEAERKMQHLLASRQPSILDVAWLEGRAPGAMTQSSHAVVATGDDGVRRVSLGSPRPENRHRRRARDERRPSPGAQQRRTVSLSEAVGARDASVAASTGARVPTPTMGDDGASALSPAGVRSLYAPPERADALEATVEALRSKLRELAGSRAAQMAAANAGRKRQAEDHAQLHQALVDREKLALDELEKARRVLANALRSQVQLRKDMWALRRDHKNEIQVLLRRAGCGQRCWMPIMSHPIAPSPARSTRCFMISCADSAATPPARAVSRPGRHPTRGRAQARRGAGAHRPG